MNGRVAAVVPAAGASRRMGVSKPLLDAGGRTFLERVLGLLREGGCRPLVVAVREGDDAVARVARDGGAEVVRNPTPAAGPIASIRAALRHLQEQDAALAAIAVHPADHPLVQPQTVRRLLEVYLEQRPLLVVPSCDGRSGHPTIFGHLLFDELFEEGLSEGARTVVHRHEAGTLRVETGDEGVLADIDTPEAYRSRFGGAHPGSGGPER